MSDIGKIVIKGKIRIVTPVHIGGPQEKHLMRGLDYLVNSGKVYFLDEKKIIAKTGILNYSNALANNQLTRLLNNQGINLNEVSAQATTNIVGEIGTDIKTNIKDPLTGRPIIPGSSLKGSLRSVLYKYAGGNSNNNERKVFGNIAEDLFRFIIIHDIPFHQSNFINTKTFNLRNASRQLMGGWKHNLHGQTTESFDSNGFTFPCEVIDIGDIGDFSIIINQKLYETVNTEQQKVSNFNRNNPNARPKPNVLKTNNSTQRIFSNQFDLFEIIQQYTKSYLEKEKAFYETYNTDKSEKIITEIEKLIELNEQSPLLRLGLGSGFHAMTGDTQFNSHVETGFWGDPVEKDFNHVLNPNFDRNYLKFGIPFKLRKARQGTMMFKSRKLAFSGSGDDLKLFPMGFVQLMTNEYYEQHFKSEFESRKQRLKQQEAEKLAKLAEAKKAWELAQAKALEDEKNRAEQERIAKEEALKPKMMEISQLKKAKWVDGVVTGQDGKKMLFKAFISGFEDKIQEVTYASGMPIGTIIQVMCSSPNGKILQFSGAPKLKNG